MRTLRAVLVARAALLVCATSVADACHLHFRDVPDSRTIDGACVTLPAEVEGGAFVVETTIDGRGPYRLLLDTGASGMVLSPRVAEQLDLRRRGFASGDGKTAVAGGDGTVARVSQGAQVGEVRAGGIALRGIDALLIDMTPFESVSGCVIDGVLPAGAFRGFLLTMDFAAGAVVVSEGELPPPDGAEILPLDDSTLPRVTIDVGGRPMSLVIDSGSDGFLDLPATATGGLQSRSEPRLTGRVQTIGGQRPQRQARLACDVALGRHRLAQPVVTLSAADYASCGTALLESFRTTFDMANRRVRFERPTDAPVTCRQVRSVGFGVLRGGGAWTVAYVLDGSPAASAGLLEGDRIETIDGLPAAKISKTMFGAVVATSPSVRLGVADARGTREVVVEVATLVE
jgi:hypothetical protein